MYNKNLKFIVDFVKGNIYSRNGAKIKYIVIHDTGNTNAGANAKNHKNYVGSNERGASAHYFVDENEIRQYVPDSKSAGSVGDGKGKFGITNSNSISIEMCLNSDGDFETTYSNTIELVKNMMIKFNISADNVVRHYDASRKCCPCILSKNNWKKWWEFKELIKEPLELKIDLEKTSTAEEKEQSAMNNDFDNEYKEAIEKGITDGTRPNETATRKEVAVMILRALKNKTPE
ncbi:MAG: peptidoglycan recognition family protein [Peptoniphilus sp.]|uniref:peptidoglycan recognition protein family protein n=1 Tax=Peptoniphilus sp. TaxID=1971214 RepID=UPI002A747A80|nr:peptidoglycan recognition family protein [Peptoniphilus sp.]MDY2987719.1 peptidoglycan recognition family protein [Peptoniphilus sp.]